MNGPRKPGDIGDPVADNIRSEQMADARPSADEVNQEHRAFLRREGCHVCGEDDPDELEMEMKAGPSCPVLQTPPGQPPTRVACEEHAVGGTEWRRQDITERLESSDGYVAVAWYDCGRATFISEPEDADERAPPMDREFPKADIRCQCGEELDRVQFPDSGGD